MTTAKELQASFGRRKPNPDEANELYRLRELEVKALSEKSVITIADIQTLEWGGRFAIANEHLDKCDEQARHALLHDQHHGVRSAAALFKPREKVALPSPPAAPVVPANVVDVARAIMNGKQRIATTFGLKTQAGVEEMIVSTHPIGTLERAEAFIAGFEGDENAMHEGVAELLAELRAATKPNR